MLWPKFDERDEVNRMEDEGGGMAMIRDLETTATCLRCGSTYIASLVSCPLCDAGGGGEGDGDYTNDLPLISGVADDWQSGVADAVNGKKGKGFKKPRLFVRMPQKEGRK